MPKKKKTRKQKIRADLRHHEFRIVDETISLEKSTTLPVEEKTSSLPRVTAAKPALHNSIATAEYQYLSKDLLKTLSLTVSVVIAELLIHFLGKGV